MKTDGLSVSALVKLEGEVARLSAIDAITQLVNKYGYMLDKGYYDDIPALFVPESVAIPELYHDGVRYVGADGIRRVCNFFRARHAAGKRGPAPLEFVDHIYTQHVITVLPGNRQAYGRSRILVQMARHKTHPAGAFQAWGGGIYENEFRQVDGIWMFSRINLNINWATPFDEGWAQAEDRPPPPPVLFPDDPNGPDELVDHGAAMWPSSTAAFPFHFGHPVTGEPITDRLPVGQEKLI